MTLLFHVSRLEEGIFLLFSSNAHTLSWLREAGKSEPELSRAEIRQKHPLPLRPLPKRDDEGKNVPSGQRRVVSGAGSEWPTTTSFARTKKILDCTNTVGASPVGRERPGKSRRISSLAAPQQANNWFLCVCVWKWRVLYQHQRRRRRRRQHQQQRQEARDSLEPSLAGWLAGGARILL